METSLFIPALSKTLPESCLQGLASYLVLQLWFVVYKKSTPALRFNLYYATTVFLFLAFLFTFYKHYQEAGNAAFIGTFSTNVSIENLPATISKPNLWLQFNYWTNHYAYTISGLYLIGLMFCVLRLLLGLININWFKKSQHLQLETNLSAQVIKLSLDFSLIKKVSVFLSEKIQVPLTIGFFKPIIVFPIALVNQLSAEQTEAILLHELAHIKRADYLWNIVLSIVQSFMFFNPIVWLMSREISKYREQCCDDLVLDKTQHQLAYARALLLIEEHRSTSLDLALASNGQKYTLLNRIKRITNMKTNDPSPQNKLIILLLAITTIGISVAWNMPVKKAIKHLADNHFKAVKEALDTAHVEQITNAEISKAPSRFHSKINSNKTVFHANDSSDKKMSVTSQHNVLGFRADTSIKTKNKFKIVLEDSVGNKKEYNSVEELPKDEQKEFLKENGKLDRLQNFDFKFKFPDSNKFVYNFNNKLRSNLDWKKQGEAMRKQGELMRKQGQEMREKLRLQLNSPEFKKQMEDLRKQSAAIGEQARKQFDSPEFKLQIEKLKEESKALGEQAKKQFNTPEFRKQVEVWRLQGSLMGKQGEEMRKYYQSPEWKKQQKKIQKEIEKSQKEWRKSYDEQPKPAMPEKTTEPQEL